MKRKEFKEKLFDALKSDVDNMSYDEKMILVNNLLIDFEKENEYLRDTSNKGQKWKDEELWVGLIIYNKYWIHYYTGSPDEFAIQYDNVP